jgi:hypothetical protein
MSKRFMLAVWDLDLPRPEKAVLAAFAWNADEEGKNSRPSVGTVGERAGYSIRQTRNIIARLKARGALRVEGKHTSSHGYVFAYAIDLSGVPRLSEALSVQKLPTSSRQFEVSSRQSATSKSAIAIADEQYEQVKQNSKNKQKDKPRRKTAREDFSLFPSGESQDDPAGASLALSSGGSLRGAPSNQTSKKSRKQTLPDWVPPDAWEGFAEMREQKHAPLTPRAVKLILSKLQDLRESGQDIGAVLDQSTLSGWKGIFPVNVNGANHGNHSNRAQQRTEGNLALLAEYRPAR